MSGFTPGPWRLIEDGDEWGVQMGMAGGFMLEPEANPEANARLLVEAPTLHDLLLTTIWVKKSDGQQYCHRCLAGRAEGHTADCELDAVFRRIGSETGTG